MAVGLPDGTATPSLFSPSTARTDRLSCGVVPRNVARYGKPRSAASLLKYAVATTLFAAPCSHTNTTAGSRPACCWSKNINASNTPCIVSSLESQGLNWIEPRREARRVVTEEHADRRRTSERDSYRVRRDTRRPLKRISNRLGTEPSDRDADPATEEAEDHCFHQELSQNVPATSADRLPKTDLAGAFRDRHEHDVHDPDAADEQ